MSFEGCDRLIVAIGSIQGWFEGDITHFKSDHVFLGYDCVMYTHKVPRLDIYHTDAKPIVYFYVTNHDGVLIEGCKVKKCGVRLLYREDFENKWKNPIDLSFLKRRLKLNGNGRCNDEPPSHELSIARDWQYMSSATSLDFNLMVGSTVIDTAKPHFKRLKTFNYENK
ncbi:hypothetical protein Patl1_21832 [Pistacia atlantica]|uniref:Uncharacterized protein n=1 Tax=Pistacia atlantica TaxID=434234 RepID=A0ACC1BKY3_9ROSI|nr:hypothetical protein Patl1_21832 [Pistacia atlantica]